MSSENTRDQSEECTAATPDEAYNHTPKRHRVSATNSLDSYTTFKSSDFTCPICFDQINEAHITRCGHTFCYDCIKKSLFRLGTCPKCNAALSMDQVFPNFMLNDIITKHKQCLQGIDGLSEDGTVPSDILLKNLISAESKNLTLPDINVMLELLSQRKQLLEAESCEAQNKLLNEFLRTLLQKKEADRKQLNEEITLIRRDLNEVDNILKEFVTQSENGHADLNQLAIVSNENGPSKAVTNMQPLINSKSLPSTSTQSIKAKPAFLNFKPMLGLTSNNPSLLATRRKRMFAHFDDFVQCYFACRSKEFFKLGEEDTSSVMKSARPSTGSHCSLDDFRECLVKFSRYNSLRQLARLNYASDLINNSTIVSSIEFDKDSEYFAIAGVTKRIKVFDYSTVINDVVDIHYPVTEMVSSSKISCISWNTYHKNILASSDYEGIVTVWDVATTQKNHTFQEHEKRCWSVDFNNVDTRMIASGSDDSRVKLWSLNVERSVATLEVKANVCCVKFNPKSAYHLAFGSADHCVHYYDLRKLKEPYCVFKDHRKAVSYVKFINSEEIVSASTDSHLKMWNINSMNCQRSFIGHTNEKNFIGLATDGDYVACGSENNSLYVYYKGLSKHLFSYRFDGVRNLLETERANDEPNEFVSAVCFKQGTNILVAANSQGYIKILELV